VNHGNPLPFLPQPERSGLSALIIPGGILALAYGALVLADQPVADFMRDTIDPDNKTFIWLLGRAGRIEYWLIVLAALLSAPRLLLRFKGSISHTAARFPYAGLYLTLCIALSALLGEILKISVGRVRPNAAYRLGHDIADPLSLNSSFHSFPSGHTQTAWAAAISLGLYFPKCRPPLILLAVCTMFSRVMMNRHFISDTLVGFAVALGCSQLARPVLARITRTENWKRFYGWLVPLT
jgi:membrane-associated phospholipid phosphatase